MNKAVDDLENRRPVWEALSDLFLDTDVSLARKWRVKKLAASPYTVNELQLILIEEVYPTCIGNLFCIAGEWAGFDPTWLEERILRRGRSRRFNLGKLTVPASFEWRATKSGVVAARKGMASSG